MAVRTNNTNTQAQNNNEFAEIRISGKLESVYIGKKYAYATISATNTNKAGTYSLFKVRYPLNFDFPEDGEPITVTATVNTFKGEYTLLANV